MIRPQHTMSALCVLAGLLGVQMGIAGVNRLQGILAGDFPNLIPPCPGLVAPDWLVVSCAHGRLPLVITSLVVPLAAALFLIPRGRPLLGWSILGVSVLVFTGGGLWIWLHAVFNADFLAGK